MVLTAHSDGDHLIAQHDDKDGVIHSNVSLNVLKAFTSHGTNCRSDQLAERADAKMRTIIHRLPVAGHRRSAPPQDRD